MLVLMRRAGESIRIGIDADVNTAIDREEIYLRKLKERGIDVDPVFGVDELEEEEDEPVFEERANRPERAPVIKMIWSGSRYQAITQVPVIVKKRKALIR